MQALDMENLKEKVTEFLEKAKEEFTPFQIRVIILLVIVIGVGAFISYSRSRPKQVTIGTRNKQVVLNKAGGARKLLVHVAGEVAKPGLYRLDEGSRVADAIDAAGGATQAGSLDQLNLASKVRDGDKILVPTKVQSTTYLPTTGTEDSQNGIVNINTASESEIEKLPGIGSELAKRIVQYRTKNGSFSSISELKKVEGIGEKRFEAIKELVRI